MIYSTFLPLFAIVSLSESFLLCPLLGPTIPVPASLPQSPIFHQTLRNITASLDQGIGSKFLGVDFNTTSFSVSIFSIAKNSTPKNDPFLWQYQHTAPSLKDAASGVKTVDADSIYRIGSLTKVFTVLNILVNAGDSHWDSPITKYLPELASAAKSLNAEQRPLDYVNWDDVTMGNLASHMAGIGRDYALGELISSNSDFAGFSPTNSSQIPACGFDPVCTRAQFFSWFTKRPPVYLASTTPVYSNAAYQLLEYALENITNKPFETLLNQSIFTSLNMTRSSLLKAIEPAGGVIPVNETASGWAIDGGDEAPAGSMFSTLRDITIAGRAILNSTLLKPIQTRRWLKPVTHTASPLFSFGRPWEITTLPANALSPTIEVYAKEGNLELYSSYLALIPDFEIGIAILQADSITSPVPDKTALFIARKLVAALQTIGQEQAQINIAGTYNSSDSSITLSLVANDGLPGLAVTSLQTNTTDLRALYASFSNIAPNDISMRLYPTNLRSGLTTAFRSVFQDTSVVDDGSNCMTWSNMDSPTYGGIALDEFLLDFNESGGMERIRIAALGVSLYKV